MDFGFTAVTVLLMMIYAVPGFIFIKTKLIKPDNIQGFAVLLLYVCQPALSIYSFNKVTYSKELFMNMLLVLLICFIIQAGVILLVYFLLRKKFEDVSYRVFTISCVLGNIGFLGVPLLEALLPDYPEALAYCAMYIVSMNIIAWTLAAYILSKDKKYISIKRIMLNPPILSLIISLPLFFTKTKLNMQCENLVTVLGKMTTPLCMLILGMRLATVNIKDLFTDKKVYIACICKLVLLPIIGFGLASIFQMDYEIKQIIFILCCCPCASIVLNLSEIFGDGQKTAANVVLLSTMFSMLTIPLMLLLI